MVENHLRACVSATAVTILIVLTYVSAYLSLVTAVRIGGFTSRGGEYPSNSERLESMQDAFFGPIHDIDRTIRPHFWQ